MRLLVVSSRPPWPPKMADAMTVDRLVRFLADRGHEVDLATFVQDAAEDRALRDGLGAVCRRIETVRLPAWRSYASTAATLPGRLRERRGGRRSPRAGSLEAGQRLS